ncbi:alpha/beta hydrolase [Novipirellula artificiosorum]|uniref:Phospholipase/Carboxylesterase n=1 Tax=Novipirellula artificiosorum TaxID=2528016 RepID=A0A5C6DPW3_9BACT|nr:alpha/beta hydrolase-fold protein [Novipirellula artificiosorum]TWU37056.1 Phospholipase/Carboxylesterase [Novipirellula artificiosorum]
MNRFDPTETWGPSPTSPLSQSDSKPKPFSSDSPAFDDPLINDLSFQHAWGEDDFSDEDASGCGHPASSSGFALQHSFFVPLHYEANYQYPLLIWLHSDGYNENQVKQVIPHISLRNFVAVGTRASHATDSAGYCYEWRQSAASVQAAHEHVLTAIDEATDRFSIHRSRVVLAGYQSGGTMAMQIALRDPQRFAGVVSLGGHLPRGCRSLANLQLLRDRRLPMLWQWANEGPNFCRTKLDRDLRTAMMIRAKLEVRQYAGDDEMTTIALADLNEWIMSSMIPNEQNQSNQSWATSPTQFSHN